MYKENKVYPFLTASIKIFFGLIAYNKSNCTVRGMKLSNMYLKVLFYTLSARSLNNIFVEY